MLTRSLLLLVIAFTSLANAQVSKAKKGLTKEDHIANRKRAIAYHKFIADNYSNIAKFYHKTYVQRYDHERRSLKVRIKSLKKGIAKTKKGPKRQSIQNQIAEAQTKLDSLLLLKTFHRDLTTYNSIRYNSKIDATRLKIYSKKLDAHRNQYNELTQTEFPDYTSQFLKSYRRK